MLDYSLPSIITFWIIFLFSLRLYSFLDLKAVSTGGTGIRILGLSNDFSCLENFFLALEAFLRRLDILPIFASDLKIAVTQSLYYIPSPSLLKSINLGV